MNPASRRFAHSDTASTTGATASGAHPLLVASPETFTWTNTGSGRVARASILRASSALDRVSTASTQARAWLILLDCRGPIKWMRAPSTRRTASAVARASWTRLWPTSTGPPRRARQAAASWHSAGVRVLAASSRATWSVRPAARAASSMARLAAEIAS